MKFVQTFESYNKSDESKEYWWVVVYPNAGKEFKNVVAIGCASDKSGDSYVEKFNNVSDIKVYNVEYYGKTTLEKIKEYYSDSDKNLDYVLAQDFKGFGDVNRYVYKKLYGETIKK
jgi:hypothetical protein